MTAQHRMQVLLERLRSLFAHHLSFSEDSWAAGEVCFSYRHYAAGEHVIEAGEHVTQIGFMVKGLARYYYITAEGKEFNKAFAQKGHPLTSIISLATDQPSPFYIQTLAASECLFMAYADLSALCERYSQWALLSRVLLEQLAIKKERREADFLLLSAQERYEKFLVEYREIADHLPNYHIASYLGITEVGLSRIRRRLGMTALNSVNLG